MDQKRYRYTKSSAKPDKSKLALLLVMLLAWGSRLRLLTVEKMQIV